MGWSDVNDKIVVGLAPNAAYPVRYLFKLSNLKSLKGAV